MSDDTFWLDRPVLVTGCTGLLGSWVARALADRGGRLTGLVRDWVPDSNFYRMGLDRQTAVVRGSLEDYLLVERLLAEYEIDTVFHVAAQTIVGIANRNPLSTFTANIQGTWNILEASRRVPTVKRVVVASSDKAYGTHEELPYTEAAPLQGTHPYDVSKSCADLIARAYFVTYRLPVCITRCGNLFGGGDLNFNRLIPGTIRSALRGERPVIRSDGTFIRDYLYARDAAEAYLLLAEQMDRLPIHGEAFNFSNEVRVTVLDLTRTLLRLCHREDLEPILLNEADHEIRHQYLSGEKARRVLGWKPATPFEVGLSETVGWYRAYFKGVGGPERTGEG